MKIVEVNIPKEKAGNGLEDITMKQLDDIVILAGKNGSGKSRILNNVMQTLGDKPTKSKIEKLKGLIYKLENAISGFRFSIDEIEKQPHLHRDYAEKIKKFEQDIRTREEDLNSYKRTLEWNYLETDGVAEQYPCVNFVPKELDITDSMFQNRNELKQNAQHVDYIGVSSLKAGTIAKIQIVQDKWLHATHPDNSPAFEETQYLIEEYENLKMIIKSLLNVELGRTYEGDATLFGFPIGSAKLSDGQKILLQLSVAIHSQGNKLESLILILDEPENHLHPSVIIEVIDKLRNTLKMVKFGLLPIPYH